MLTFDLGMLVSPVEMLGVNDYLELCNQCPWVSPKGLLSIFSIMHCLVLESND